MTFFQTTNMYSYLLICFQIYIPSHANKSNHRAICECVVNECNVAPNLKLLSHQCSSELPYCIWQHCTHTAYCAFYVVSNKCQISRTFSQLVSSLWCAGIVLILWWYIRWCAGIVLMLCWYFRCTDINSEGHCAYIVDINISLLILCIVVVK